MGRYVKKFPNLLSSSIDVNTSILLHINLLQGGGYRNRCVARRLDFDQTY